MELARRPDPISDTIVIVERISSGTSADRFSIRCIGNPLDEFA